MRAVEIRHDERDAAAGSLRGPEETQRARHEDEREARAGVGDGVGVVGGREGAVAARRAVDVAREALEDEPLVRSVISWTTASMQKAMTPTTTPTTRVIVDFAKVSPVYP